ncbi:MAG TPA: tRNA (adenosine(37)-N6)-threonylcarbamoyltransferase complex ATPase subunit type 1 TsaE [Candidatus Limnocylindria bacterium]|nr:tRNA (adenosine(37)-N6)-threonylcarbamoyltransferase complex ATPase subunit type 1 TsaE [Candidatus Limnocylindria bacterium]
MDVELLSSGEEDTRFVARALGSFLVPGDVVALTGDLGAGKTVFCKGVGESLGIFPDRILSPSFTIVTEHQGRLPLCHVDVYRLSSEEEARDAGLDEILSGKQVCVVEWAEKIRFLLPNDCIRVTFLISGETSRRLSVSLPDEARFGGFLSRVRSLVPGG